ncbi:MAG: ROK family protein [Candidatus Cyclobacteriaceae bacterium M2_1C_046]
MLWGIDLGGTKIEGVVLESSVNPEVLCRLRISTEAEKGYEHILNQIKRLLMKMEDETGKLPEKIGIGTPGSIDPHTQLLKNSNSTSLNGQPFKKDIERILKVPVAIANDANCFALAETHFGVVRDIKPGSQGVFGVIMGTGVGGGIVINGNVINGNMGIAGEWGHNFLDESGGPCYCGKTGCVETVISGPALQNFYERESGEKATLKEIYHKYKSGDKHAGATINRLMKFFGLGISSVINMLDPQVIVIGGGVGNIEELYTEGVEQAKKYTFNNRFDTKIVPPKLGDSAGVFGAALLTS